MLRQSWWKITGVMILLYVFIAGFLIRIPSVGNLYETGRNVFFHVPMWPCQFVLISFSVVYSVLYLRKNSITNDIFAVEFARTGTVFGALGLITGSIWARYTWGTFWSNDPKQLGVAIAMLVYLAYFVLRNSITDIDKRGRIGAVYNIFAYSLYVPMVLILPRLVESLHPGGKGVDGNPGLGGKDMDATMTKVFLPAMLGWVLLSLWIATLRTRYKILEEKKLAS